MKKPELSVFLIDMVFVDSTMSGLMTIQFPPAHSELGMVLLVYICDSCATIISRRNNTTKKH